MESIKRIRINKNRGWRGLAELVAENERREDVAKMIFSFSQPVWEDMLKGFIVMQDEDNYIILEFDNTDALPKPTQQRSVLIKSFYATVINQYEYAKDSWAKNTPAVHYNYIEHFTKNRNNHTTSDWNCIRYQSNTNDIGRSLWAMHKNLFDKGGMKHAKSRKKCGKN